MTCLGSDHGRNGRIGFGSWPNRPPLQMTLHPFCADFLHILECNFWWQVQYLVTLEGEACCSAHCR